MVRALVFLAAAFLGQSAVSQQVVSRGDKTPASPAWPFGPPRTRVKLEGLLMRSDGETLSIALPDQRIIRIRLNQTTLYNRVGPSAALASFQVADFVAVESEVAGSGLLEARSVRFLRRPSHEETEAVLRSPELMQRWRSNDLSPGGRAEPDELRLASVPKPSAIDSGPAEACSDALIPRIRRNVIGSLNGLPNLRSKQVTSLFHSTSRPVKWIPEGVITAEIGIEDGSESYADLTINGHRPPSAPENADVGFIKTLDKAWSTGDFEGIANCVFSELQDADFSRAGGKFAGGRQLAHYEFAGQPPSACVGVQYRSVIVYPGFKGSLDADVQTGEVVAIRLEATGVPSAFPLDRAERSVDFEKFTIASKAHLLPATAFWFGCFRNSSSCFLNRIDFSEYRRFEADSKIEY